MNLEELMKVFRDISVILYVIIIIITIVISGLALYLAAKDIMTIIINKIITDVEILGALSAMFLVVIALEFVDMFIEYIRSGTVVVDLVIAIVLTALSRELLLYVAEPTEPVSYGYILIASIIVLALAYWLVGKTGKK